ncbi:MAG: ABC transporter ATP-binding protein [Patescibacteria group bacterium]|nr:ABC transporter ATP-binding protein [Patescibacteria group bacterium]
MKKLIRRILGLSEVLSVLNESFRGFRVKLFWLAVLGFFGGLLDSLGINVLIPVFSYFTKSSGGADDFVSRTIAKYISYLPFQHNLIFLLSLAIGLFLLRALVYVVFSYVSYSTMIDYRNRSVKKLLGLVFGSRWTFLLKQRLGYLQTTILKDMQTTSDTMVFLSRFIISVTSLLVYLFFALNISFGITLLTLLVGGIAVIFIFPFIKKNRAIFAKMAATEKSISGYLIENISGAKYVKSLTVEDAVVQKGEQLYDIMRSLQMKIVVFRSILSNFMQPMALVFISALFFFYSKQQDFNLPTFIVTVYFIQNIFTNMDGTQGAFHSVNEQIPFIKNTLVLKAALEENQEEESGEAPFTFNHDLRLEGVSFSYDEKTPILSDVSLGIRRGEVVGLIGPSGAGKSSIADLLLKFLKPQQGNILLDGIRIDEIDTRQWRENIGYVSQDVFLVNDTIENNIRFYSDGVTKEDMMRGAKLANALEFIDKLPDGFNTVVGDRGVMLSGGQRQRIVLARVLARNPSILILDEATSALDNESELQIQRAIGRLRGTMTIVIIAHRLSTVMDADNLFVLEAGKIVEQGNPAELIKNKGSYFYKMSHLKQ